MVRTICAVIVAASVMCEIVTLYEWSHRSASAGRPLFIAEVLHPEGEVR